MMLKVACFTSQVLQYTMKSIRKINDDKHDLVTLTLINFMRYICIDTAT